MTTVNIVTWLVIGGIVGVVVAFLRQRGTGGIMLLDLVVGVVGGFVGGLLLNMIGGIVGAEIAGVNLGGGLVALVAAIILVVVAEMFMHSPQQ
jgi:uncharacterized membrane protein YeaQ/YmgE (transglycosylase-associated protein family)